MIAIPSIGFAERESLWNNSDKPEDQLFDYKLGWDFCNEDIDLIIEVTAGAHLILKRAGFDYIPDTAEYSFNLDRGDILDRRDEMIKIHENREVIKEQLDVLFITKKRMLRGKEICQSMKDEGYFGLEHKKD